jgi:CHAD domain-containing protein
VEKLYRRIVDAGQALGPEAPADALHGLRIECKKMRYVLDGTRRLFAEQPAAEVLAALKQLQSALGQANDAHVQGGLLQTALTDLAAAGTVEPATLLAAGRLDERIAARGAAARADFAPRFAAFAAEATRARVRRLARRPRKRAR